MEKKRTINPPAKRGTVSKFILFGILGLAAVLAIVGAMFAFVLCPPKGPWPMPPWCLEFPRNSYSADGYAVGRVSQEKAVQMADTWGRNYNFGMSGVTWKNIAPSFDRVAALGAKEVYVHDFHWAKGGKNFSSSDYSIEGDTFWNDFRDEEISKEHLKELAREAHSRGLKIGYQSNLAFVNIGKYIGLEEIDNSVKNDYQEFNRGHSDEWTRDFFSKWEERMLEKADILNEAGFDIMGLTPTWMGPEFRGNEALANSLWKDLIKSVKGRFEGKVAVILNAQGFLQDTINTDYEDYQEFDYYKEADIVQVNVYNLFGEYSTGDFSREGLSLAYGKLLSDIDSKAREKGVELSILFAPFSYEKSANLGIVEFYDILSPKVKGLKADYQHQADQYQAFLEGLEGKENIGRVIVGSFWWDDALDPAVQARISIAPSPRNKPAEAVIGKWFSS